MSPLPLKGDRNILKRALEQWLTRRWFSGRPILWLKPLAFLYQHLSERRRRAFLEGDSVPEDLPVPVIVVGNLIAGGAGKSPAVAALVETLLAHGRHPGILLRGYGRALDTPHVLTPSSTVAEVGDEALLHYRALRVPVAVGQDRVEAARSLLARHPTIDCLVSDDGLQHYGLGRDIELVVIDRERGFGNEALIPAGPLRESMARLNEVDALLLHPESIPKHAHRAPHVPRLEITTTMLPPRPLEDWWAGDRSTQSDWSVWADDTVHAVAGIAYPERFFTGLEKEGLKLIRHPFSDHHHFTPEELIFSEPYPVLMTEKDAVKCGEFNLDQHWVVPLKSMLSKTAEAWLIETLESVNGRKTA